MPDGGPHNEEYTHHHPDAIEDRDLAEEVGFATKLNQEAHLERWHELVSVLKEAEAAAAEAEARIEESGRGHLALEELPPDLKKVMIDMAVKVKFSVESSIRLAEEMRTLESEFNTQVTETSEEYDVQN